MIKPNIKLYLVLFCASMLITLMSFFLSQESRAFAIVASIGCGGLTSVVVAWLFDYSTCRATNMRLKKISEFVVNGLVVSISRYLETYCDVCVELDYQLRLHHYKYDEWFELFIRALSEGKPIRKSWFVHATDDVKKQYDEFVKNVFWLIDSNIITFEEYRRIKLAAQRIICTKIYFANTEVNYKPEIYIQENQTIVQALKLYAPFENLLNISFSSEAPLHERVDLINEYDLIL